MSLSELLTIAVYVVALPAAWLVTLGLHRKSQDSDIGFLRYAYIAAFALALIVSLFALVFANNDLDIPVLTNEDTRILTRSAVLLLPLIPAAYLLHLYRRST